MDALGQALAIMSSDETYQALTEEDREIELLRLATPIAALRRNIKDKQRIKKAWDFLLPNVKHELGTDDYNIIIVFLLCYLDVHIAWGYITEMKQDDIMKTIMDNYDLPELIPEA